MSEMCATVAVVNFRAIPGDCARNLQRIKEYTEAAARRGAQIILFPELALSGADDVAYAAAAAEPVPGPAGQAVHERRSGWTFMWRSAWQYSGMGNGITA